MTQELPRPDERELAEALDRAIDQSSSGVVSRPGRPRRRVGGSGGQLEDGAASTAVTCGRRRRGKGGGFGRTRRAAAQPGAVAGRRGDNAPGGSGRRRRARSVLWTSRTQPLCIYLRSWSWPKGN